MGLGVGVVFSRCSGHRRSHGQSDSKGNYGKGSMDPTGEDLLSKNQLHLESGEEFISGCTFFCIRFQF